MADPVRGAGGPASPAGEALTGPLLDHVSLALDAADAPLVAAGVIDLGTQRVVAWVVRLAR